MPSDGGLAGALLLSEQLSTDRFLDKLERNHANAELAVDNALLRHEATEIVARYNQLVADFNDLRREAIEAALEADRRGAAIAELQHEVEALRRAKDASWACFDRANNCVSIRYTKDASAALHARAC